MDLAAPVRKRFDRNYIRERASMTFYDYKVEEDMVDEIQSILRNRRKLSKLVKIARSARDYNMSSNLGKIIQPSLLIWGRNDLITPPAVALAFMNGLPNARLKWIDQLRACPDDGKTTGFCSHSIRFSGGNRINCFEWGYTNFTNR